jgi:hypothetical protein
MSKNTIFLIDALGENWQNEITNDMRMPEPIKETVRGLTSARYLQLWKLFPAEPNNDVLLCLSEGFDVERTAEMVGLSKRQVKNAIQNFLSMARAAFEQPAFLPPADVTEVRIPVKRIRSRRGRPPKDGKAPTPASMQVPLPF